jgi:hypothetical protein
MRTAWPATDFSRHTYTHTYGVYDSSVTTEDYFKLLVPILGAIGGLTVYLSKKLQIVEDLHAEKIPPRLAVLEAIAGVKHKVRT